MNFAQYTGLRRCREVVRMIPGNLVRMGVVGSCALVWGVVLFAVF